MSERHILYSKEIQTAMLQLVARREIRCIKVLSWSIFPALVIAVCFFTVPEPIFASGFMVTFYVFISFMATWTAVSKAKTITIERVVSLYDRGDFTNWFKVIGICHYGGNVFKITIQDPFGNTTEVYSITEPSEPSISDDDLDTIKRTVAFALKEVWFPIVRPLISKE